MNRTKQMYEEDREYLDCVEDILEHPVFRSMDCLLYTSDAADEL